MACNFCGRTANQHNDTCPRHRVPRQPEEVDLTEIVRCPACTKSDAKMYFSQIWCDTCKQTIYWCGKCCPKDKVKAKHDVKKHTIQTNEEKKQD